MTITVWMVSLFDISLYMLKTSFLTKFTFFVSLFEADSRAQEFLPLQVLSTSQ